MACRWYQSARAPRRSRAAGCRPARICRERLDDRRRCPRRSGVVAGQGTPGHVDAAAQIMMVVVRGDLARPAADAAHSYQHAPASLDPRRRWPDRAPGSLADQREGDDRRQQGSVQGVVGVGGRPLDLASAPRPWPTVEQVRPARGWRAGSPASAAAASRHDRQGERLAGACRAVGQCAQPGQRWRARGAAPSGHQALRQAMGRRAAAADLGPPGNRTSPGRVTRAAVRVRAASGLLHRRSGKLVTNAAEQRQHGDRRRGHRPSLSACRRTQRVRTALDVDHRQGGADATQSSAPAGRVSRGRRRRSRPAGRSGRRRRTLPRADHGRSISDRRRCRSIPATA